MVCQNGMLLLVMESKAGLSASNMEVLNHWLYQSFFLHIVLIKKAMLKFIKSLLVRTAFFLFLWWVLSMGRFTEPIFVGFVLIVGIASSYGTIPMESWRISLKMQTLF